MADYGDSSPRPADRGAEFNEVFITDLRLPREKMLGAEGDGWRVDTTTLMNERVGLNGGDGGRGGGPIRTLMTDLVVRPATHPY